MARALASAGIEVHAFEANSKLPGSATNIAKVHFIRNIKSDSLVDDLIRFRAAFEHSREIVLFPTNDNNVKIIAQHITQLSPHFLLSWWGCADQVLSLLLKSNIETRCKEVGLNYPQSFVVRETSDVAQVGQKFEFPIIAKPVNPQSGFKAIKCKDINELSQLLETYQADLPIIVQHWISGTDEDLYFGALYLADGDVQTEFVGKKLESFPPAMGQTTVAVTTNNDTVMAITKSFFDGLNMSGPVSLELKKDRQGRYWVIEPTVGRTDFWVGLCIASGCNLLLAEYQHATGQVVSDFSPKKSVIWFDSERDITAFPRHLSMYIPFFGKGFSTAFSYLQYGDLAPFNVAAKKLITRVKYKIAKRIGFQPEFKNVSDYHTFEVNNVDLLPEDFKDLLDSQSELTLFNSAAWYTTFCQQVADKQGEVKFYCMVNQQNEAVAVMPMWRNKKKLALTLNINVITSLTNYYTPCYRIAIDENKVQASIALEYLVAQLNSIKESWHLIDFFPLKSDLLEAIANNSKRKGSYFFPYWMTKNYYQYINGSYQDYFTGLPSRVKNTIKRKKKQLDSKTDWDIKIVDSSKEIESYINKYHAVYNNSWKKHEPYPEFISALIRTSAINGQLRLGVLTIDNEPAATQLWLVENSNAYIYKLAYDNKYKMLSPGTVLTAAMFERVIDVDKVEKIDFLTGNDAFKRDWMSQSKNLFGIQIINPKSIVGCYLLAKNRASQIRKKVCS